ncbi:MAG: cyclomaltodextrinase [Treponemataceae bacterium]|nr:cyclomaltodextrinase [Treponemataceae bacterium]
MNFNECVFYQIYPMTFCAGNRIKKISQWADHIKNLGCNALYLSPIFQSDRHGYDTQDYFRLDERLGSNDDFAQVCQELHDKGIQIVLDGVFNHVGRGFWAFQDLKANGKNSAYKDWFYIDWNKNSNDNDGFYYQGWEGHYELVKLNLSNPDVRNQIFSAIRMWKEKFQIDGLRLDVAYCLDKDFLKELHELSSSLGIFLLGETIHSQDMNMVNQGLLDSATNYEVYKGLHSSLNCMNMFEISYSLNRLFAYQGIFSQKISTNPLFNFVDNHDVDRIASLLKNKAFLPLIYGLLFAIPGSPCIYYGSEWQTEGKKSEGDPVLRPDFQNHYWNSLTDFIQKLSRIRKNSLALKYGYFENLFVSNSQYVFRRMHTDPYTGKKESVIVAVNLSESEYWANIKMSGNWKNLFTGQDEKKGGSLKLPPVSIQYFMQEN